MEKKILRRSAALIEKYYKKYDDKFAERNEVESRFRATMDFIQKNFPGDRNDFVFFKKTIFYTFFIVCYDMLFGLSTPASVKKKQKKILSKNISELKLKNDRIRDRTAAKKVLEATDRRTTNPKEREILFEYLRNA